MQTHHTPGPWTIESDDGVDFTVIGGKSSQVRIAVECSERDARLIAAAPDLLAALHRAAAALASVSYSDPSIESAYSTVLAAIARAHGE